MPIHTGACHGTQMGYRCVMDDPTRNNGETKDDLVQRIRELEIQLTERDAELSRYRALRDDASAVEGLRLEEALTRRHHAVLRGALETLNDGLVIFDADERIALCNTRYLELHPLVADLMVPGTHIEDLARAAVARGQHPEALDDPETWIAERLHAFRNPGRPLDQVFPDGRQLQVYERKIADGGTIGVRIDITEHMAARQALQDARDQMEGHVAARTEELVVAIDSLRESESRLRDFANSSADWFWEMDAELRFTYMSPNVAQIVGVPPEWHYGKTREDILGPGYDADVWEAHLQTLRRHEPFRDFVYYRVGDGIEPRWLSSSGVPVFDDDGDFLGYRGSGSDVSQMRAVEAELRGRQEMLDAVVENLPVALCLKDREGRFTLVNPAFERLHGKSAAEVLDKTFFDILSRPVAEAAAAEDRMVLESGEVMRTDYSWPEELGVRQDEIIIKFPLWSDRSGPPDGLGVIALNVTENRELEERLQQAQKMDAIGQLTGGVAHDFNNLLAIIHGNAELLAAQDGTDRSLVGAILRSSGRGAELTRRLLAFSRQQPLDARGFDMGVLVGEMSELLGRTLGETVEIGIRTPADLWPVFADAGQTENALLNLAVNARDAMPSGGTLTIECRNLRIDDSDAAQQIEVVPGDYVLLSVSDSGHGMTANVRERVFEPFYTTKEVGRGSGLGLSMVYGFAKQSGGHVSIYSEVGQGTTVHIYLPRERNVIAQDSDDAPTTVMGTGQIVLVIEDDADVRAMAVAMLERLDYRTLDAADAATARDILASGTEVDIVLSDVVLPGGMSGPEFADEVRARFPSLPVVFMSGYPDEASRRNGFVDSENILLNKPFQRAELAEALDQARKRPR